MSMTDWFATKLRKYITAVTLMTISVADHGEAMVLIAAEN
jgi:hypothetical protein